MLRLTEPPLTYKIQADAYQGLPGQLFIPGYHRQTILVEPVDMFKRAGQLCDEGLSVAVLNMAARTRPGGDVAGGAGAQEENFHRRSDAKRFTMDQQENYPIDSRTCLVSPDVTVFRGTEKEGYPMLHKSFKVTMLSCAAVRYPTLTHDGEYKIEWEQKLMKDKIGAIVLAAVQSKCDALILSAFGCKAINNPQKVVARMFKEQLEYAGLSEVIFCILDDHNSRTGHDRGPMKNYAAFENEFVHFQ